MRNLHFDNSHVFQQNGNAIEMTGPATGHTTQVVLICLNSRIAADTLAALKLWQETANKSTGA